MKTLAFIVLLIAILSGCSLENPEGVVEDSRVAEVKLDQIIAIAKQASSLSEESVWLVSAIGAQLLKIKYDRYAELGLDESDFDRMPDNALTENIRRLYRDMKPMLQ